MLPFILAVAASGPSEYLAPTSIHHDESIARVERLLMQLEVQERRWSEAQRRWVDAEGPKLRCKPAIACARIVLQIHDAAKAVRRIAQSARAEWYRAERMAKFRPVGVLIRGARRVRKEEVRESLGGATKRFLTRNTWDRIFVLPWAALHQDLLQRISGEPVGGDP